MYWMKKRYITIALITSVIIIFQACSKQSAECNENTCYTVKACIAADKKCENDLSFIVEKKERYKISVNNSSLCPTYYFQLKLFTGNNVLLDTVFTQITTFEKIVEFSSGTQLRAEALLVPGQPMIECVWLGEANVTICKGEK